MRGKSQGALSIEAMAAIGACILLVVIVALTMRDKKPRFRFDNPKAEPTASASPAAAVPPAASATASHLQTLFVEGRQESPLIAPVEAPASPPFVAMNTDYAHAPVYRDIREADLGRIYAAAPQKDKRALSKVARLGGFGTPEAMARAFGYPSVDQMVWSWDQTVVTTPQFQANNFGTNSAPPLPWQD
ncbi:MAG: hypothetical protein IAE94_09035 [Chthoniobacterales bacterium]|nr:hypothetical protein [Chthoniobacterales bacterium]